MQFILQIAGQEFDLFLLANVDLLHALIAFQESEFSSENTKFLQAVNEIQEAQKSEQSEIIRNIINKYIGEEGSDNQINIDSSKRKNIEETFSKKKSTEDCSKIFVEVCREVIVLIQRDTIPRFIKSTFYKEYLNPKFQAIFIHYLRPIVFYQHNEVSSLVF